MLALHGWEDVATELSLLQRRGRTAEMASLVTDDMLGEFSLSAGWDDLGRMLLERYGGLADRLLPYGTAGDWQEHPGRAERWRAVAAAVRGRMDRSEPAPRPLRRRWLLARRAPAALLIPTGAGRSLAR